MIRCGPKNCTRQSISLAVASRMSCRGKSKVSSSNEFGRELAQVDEPPYRGSTTVIFELEAYPEPKSLSPDDLSALYDQLGTNKLVADHIGSSTNFACGNKQSKNKPKGKLIGRKKMRDSDLIRKLLKAGMTFRQIAQIARCSHGSVWAEKSAMMKEEAAKTLTESLPDAPSQVIFPEVTPQIAA